MKSLQQGFRDDEVHRDTYDRLHCSQCNVQLEVRNDPENLHDTRMCPDCDEEWRDL